MKALLLLVTVALAFSLPAPTGAVVQAQACDWSPSNDCPAPGVRPGAASYPCNSGQIKGDLTSTGYYLPSQAAYAGVGSGQNVWCFSTEAEAQALGFRKAS